MEASLQTSRPLTQTTAGVFRKKCVSNFAPFIHQLSWASCFGFLWLQQKSPAFPLEWGCDGLIFGKPAYPVRSNFPPQHTRSRYLIHTRLPHDGPFFRYAVSVFMVKKLVHNLKCLYRTRFSETFPETRRLRLPLIVCWAPPGQSPTETRSITSAQ